MKTAKHDWMTKGRQRSMFRKETTEEGREKKMVILRLNIKKDSKLNRNKTPIITFE